MADIGNSATLFPLNFVETSVTSDFADSDYSVLICS